MLIMIPGHMHIGYFRASGRQQPEFFETTMLGSVSLTQHGEDHTLGWALGSLLGQKTKKKNKTSAISFVRAITYADSVWVVRDREPMSKRQPGYAIIDIAAERAKGIMPLSQQLRGEKRGRRRPPLFAVASWLPKTICDDRDLDRAGTRSLGARGQSTAFAVIAVQLGRGSRARDRSSRICGVHAMSIPNKVTIRQV
jgi:hypothetical protein